MALSPAGSPHVHGQGWPLFFALAPPCKFWSDNSVLSHGFALKMKLVGLWKDCIVPLAHINEKKNTLSPMMTMSISLKFHFKKIYH